MAPSTTKSQLRWKDRNRERVNAAMREYKKRHPEKNRAHSAVAYALKTGKLVRPATCEECGRYDGWNGQTIGKIEAHHADYPQPLNVQWLCKECHNEDRNENHQWNVMV